MFWKILLMVGILQGKEIWEVDSVSLLIPYLAKRTIIGVSGLFQWYSKYQCSS